MDGLKDRHVNENGMTDGYMDEHTGGWTDEVKD